MTAQDRTQTKLVVFAVLFSVVLFVLVAILVVAIVFCTRKSGRIAQRIGIVRTEDSIKLGSTLAADDAIDEFLQAKQQTPYPVILSMTTSPARLQHLHKILQTIHPAMYDEIHLNLPHSYKRTGETYDVPASIKSFPKLRVFSQPVDFGPAMKLLPTVLRAPSKAVVVTLDDDTAYSTRDLGNVLSALAHYEYKAVVARGTLDGAVDDPILTLRQPLSLRPGDKLGDIVEGYALVGYPSWLVDAKAALDFSKLSKPCFQSDDLTISYALAVRGVPRINIHGGQDPPYLTALSYGLGGDALHVMQSHGNAYKSCAQSIRDLLASSQTPRHE